MLQLHRLTPRRAAMRLILDISGKHIPAVLVPAHTAGQLTRLSSSNLGLVTHQVPGVLVLMQGGRN